MTIRTESGESGFGIGRLFEPHDGPAQLAAAVGDADARGLRGDEAEKSERRRKPAFPLMEMVLRDPRGIEAGFLRLPDLLGRDAIPLCRRRLIE